MEERIIMAYLCVWLGIIGAVWGSFADCAVSRWAAGERMFAGRSRCGSCGHVLGAGDLVPVFSWLFRRGKCRYCGKSIPADCLWAELVLTLLAGCLLGILGAAAGRKDGAIPFGPFLALAAVLCICFGGPLVNWYLGLF